jgi:hypothetical protein
MLMIDSDHLIYVWRFLAGLVAAGLVGWGLCRLRSPRDRVDRLLLLLLPASFFVVAVISLLAILKAPQNNWNATRLTPSVALLQGETLYNGPDSGPVHNTIYPPVSYLCYLPAGLFRRPTDAIMSAVCISLILGLAPIAAVCFAPHGDEGSTRSPLLSSLVLLGFWTLTRLTDMAVITSAVHCDAPSVGFAGLACAILYVRRLEPTPSNSTLLSAAVFAALSVWSKQVDLPVLVVLPAWVLLAHGLGPCLRLCGWLATCLMACGATFAAAFGHHSLIFNIWDLPKSHPWVLAPETRKAFTIIGVEVAAVVIPALAVLGSLAYFSLRRPEAPGSAAREGDRVAALRVFLRGNFWVLFAAVGVAMVPLAMLSRIKVGGNTNCYAHVLYFLAAAPCVLLLDWNARLLEQGRESLSRALRIAVLLSPLTPLLLVDSNMLTMFNAIRAVKDNPQEVGYRYARKHPGQAYFPWNTLSTLMAEGRNYHFEYGMIDRALAGQTPSESHFRRHIPDTVSLVAFPPDRQSEWTMKYFSDFTRRVEIKELPGWICYAR